MQILQEDRTRQGVVGSQSGHETGPVSRKCPNGALYEPGFGRLSTPEKGRSGGWFSDVKYGDSVRCVGIDRGIFSGPEIFFKKKDLGEKIPVNFFYSGKFSQADH